MLPRSSVEKFLMREVYLELRVKVSDNWRKDENASEKIWLLKLILMY